MNRLFFFVPRIKCPDVILAYSGLGSSIEVSGWLIKYCVRSIDIGCCRALGRVSSNRLVVFVVQKFVFLQINIYKWSRIRLTTHSIQCDILTQMLSRKCVCYFKHRSNLLRLERIIDTIEDYNMNFLFSRARYYECISDFDLTFM